MRFRQVLLPTLVFALLAVGGVRAETPDLTPAEPTVPFRDMTPEQRQAYNDDEVAKAYLKRFRPGLTAETRLPRVLATLAVARLDDTRGTELLLQALELAAGRADVRRPQRHADPIVTWLAWEALHARLDQLDDTQRRRWLMAGVAGSQQGAFPGELSVSLLRAAASVPAESIGTEAAANIVAAAINTNGDNGPALDAARAAVAAWRDTTVVRQLLKRKFLSDANAAAVHHVLAGLPDAPTLSDEDASSERDVRRVWNRWARPATAPQPATADELTPYTSRGTMLPAPEPIGDDESWREVFEADDLMVRGLDLVWTIDATGSMAKPNLAVARGSVRVMMLLGVLSDQNRGAAIYVRHELFGPLQRNCCRNAKSHPVGYLAKPHPLVADVAGLAQAMYREPIPEPDTQRWANTHPGTAVHGMLFAADRGMQWNNNAIRAVVVVGDATMDNGTDEPATLLAADMARRGYQLHALHVGDLPQYARVFEKAAGGTSTRFNPQEAKRSALPTGPLRTWTLTETTAWETKLDPFETLGLTLVDRTVSKDYHTRVRQAIAALMPFMREAFPDTFDTPQ